MLFEDIFNEKVEVRLFDLRTLISYLRSDKKSCAVIAQYAIDTDDYSTYLDELYRVRNIDRRLALPVFDAEREFANETVPFPEWPADKEAGVPFFDDDTIDFIYSDSTPITHAVDVPF